MVGDFNINYLVPTTPLYHKLLSIVSFNLVEVVSEPTHVTNYSSTLIDPIFVSSTVSVQSCKTVPSLANADHFGLWLVFSTAAPKRLKTVNRQIWQYSLADFDRADEILDSMDWDALHTSGC